MGEQGEQEEGLRMRRCLECFHPRGQHLCKFIGIKESVCI